VILCGTLVCRGGLLFPAHVVSQKTAIKRAMLFGELKHKWFPLLKKEIEKKGRDRGWSEEKAEDVFKKTKATALREKIAEHNCAGTRIWAPFWLQIPFWIACSMALRRLCGQSREELSSEGLLWLQDLTSQDATLILPTILTCLYLANVAALANNHEERAKRSLNGKVVTGVATLFSLFMLPISSQAPSCLTLFWTSSAFAGLAVNLLVMHPKIRRQTGIPATGIDSNTPYQRIMANAISKIKKYRCSLC